jgi:hypothetical protein
MWINPITNTKLLTHSDIRSDAKNISFPSIMTDAMILDSGYLPVTQVVPTYTVATQRVEELAPALVESTWTQQWAIIDLSVEEIETKRLSTIPRAVTMRQARLALLGAGMLSAVEAAIDALPSPQKEAARIEWDYSSEVQRYNGFVSILGPLIGMTQLQIDELFIMAATL